ncbi:MAG: hypothetical protein JW841_00850 [Deltaproteobacteria bacterium]|nr:hypothetical protein [Deltaproteobacteria bacterium]
MDTKVKQLVDLLTQIPQSELLLVVTGAGVSVASGIPTFRGTDKDAIWKHDVMTMATYDFFQREPLESWRWYLSRFEKVFNVKPNATHFAIAQLEKWQQQRGEFLLVTQNIDTLHEQAGSKQMIKVHGSADRVRCTRPGCKNAEPSGSLLRAKFDLEDFYREPSNANLPRCPLCNAILRQHVLWFDEYYTSHDDYQFERVRSAAYKADTVIFIGTSFSVGVTDLIVRAAIDNQAKIISIDPQPINASNGVTTITATSEELLPEVCQAMGLEIGKTAKQ